MPFAVSVASLVVLPLATAWAAEIPFERAPINYLTATPDDPVARLQAKLKAGTEVLRHDGRTGYLRSVLSALEIPISSQVLVFSKTSFQRTRIAPETPRAIYFNDDVYVGFVQGSEVLEFSAADPALGGTFYLLEQDRHSKPSFQRQTHDCLQCHASARTQDVPGHLVRSVYPDASGQPAFNAGTFSTSHESPLRERWGGWYVTGTHGTQVHMGNALVTDREHPEKLDLRAGANLLDLSKRFDTSAYLAPGSDIVALMVLEHQVKLHNLITLANYQARLAVESAREINRALGEPEDFMSESTARRINGPVEELVRYMLFLDEAPLSGPVRGTSTFAADFAARGPRDGRGRSLRDFDLNTRMFRYPCSYLIYSRAFDALPAAARDRAYLRLWEVLSGKDRGAAFERRTPEERAAILEILRATKPGLPDYWKAGN
ncbi:hypothetical protein [Aquisphaera insulae]|uniref:hypothetical protein n=1 Tax=Aquisphaera insulae TaxID=2712864 RepID=UPI00196B06CF|nr:hypothetical protein [Aquisphaera insulae]